MRGGIGSWTAATAVVSAIALSACGSSSKSSSSSSSTSASSSASGGGSLNLTISESGRAASYSGPSSVSGGTVQLTLRNAGQKPHAAQLIRVDPPHTVAEALKIVGSSSNKTPDWIHAEGGLGPVGPGSSGTATVELAAGSYAVADVGGPGSGGPPAIKQLTVSGGSASGSLPSTPTTVTAAATGKDKYAWQISGALKTGANQITFASKGENTLHLLSVVRITGKHSHAELVKALSSNGPPPAYVDQRSLGGTAVLDSGKSLVTSLTLSQPGTYLLFCPLTDRDGGKPHFAEGLLTTVTVK